MDRRRFVEVTALGTVGLLRSERLHLQTSDWRSWRVNGQRVNRHLTDLSQYGRNPQGGVSRVAFSQADLDGRAFAMQRMRAAGLDVRIDPAGNILGRRAGSVPAAKPIVFGSHIDSVPEGGNYDGVAGSWAISPTMPCAPRGGTAYLWAKRSSASEATRRMAEAKHEPGSIAAYLERDRRRASWASTTTT